MPLVPKVEYGLIGGSGTWGARIPEALGRDDVVVLDCFKRGFNGPYGRTAAFKLLEVVGTKVLRVPMHGWHEDMHGVPLPPWASSRQVAWVFQEAGVKYALVEGSVGGVQNPAHLGELPPWSVVIPDDFMMPWCPPQDPVPFHGAPYRRMRAPFCCVLRYALLEAAQKQKRFAAVYDGGIYYCSPPGRFETKAEIKVIASWGAHIVGMSLSHEVPLMRRLGIHFGSLNIVVNHAEGHRFWTTASPAPEDMANFYTECPTPVGNAIFDALKEIIIHGVQGCECENYLLAGMDAFPREDA